MLSSATVQRLHCGACKRRASLNAHRCQSSWPLSAASWYTARSIDRRAPFEAASRRHQKLSGGSFLEAHSQGQSAKPETNVTLWLDGRRYDADCLWRKQRLILELDGHQAHGTRSAFESDRERDRRLQAAGWRVVRATWHQVVNATTLIRDLRQMLGVHETAQRHSGGAREQIRAVRDNVQT